jgi:hypothetical protein
MTERLDSLIDFAKLEPQSHQDMVEQFLLCNEDELKSFDYAFIGLSAARIEAGMRLEKMRRVENVH